MKLLNLTVLFLFIFLLIPSLGLAQEGLMSSMGTVFGKVLSVIDAIFFAVTQMGNLLIVGRIMLFVLIVVISKFTGEKIKGGGYSNAAFEKMIPVLGAVVGFFTAAFVSDGYIAGILYIILMFGEVLPLIMLAYLGYKMSQGQSKNVESWHSALFKSVVYFILGYFLLSFAGNSRVELMSIIASEVGVRYDAYSSYTYTDLINQVDPDNVYGILYMSGFGILAGIDGVFGTFFDILNVIIFLMGLWEFIRFLSLIGKPPGTSPWSFSNFFSKKGWRGNRDTTPRRDNDVENSFRELNRLTQQLNGLQDFRTTISNKLDNFEQRVQKLEALNQKREEQITSGNLAGAKQTQEEIEKETNELIKDNIDLLEKFGGYKNEKDRLLEELKKKPRDGNIMTRKANLEERIKNDNSIPKEDATKFLEKLNQEVNDINRQQVRTHE